jgi:DNA repair protein RadD
MNLRPYQALALDLVLKACLEERYLLLQAGTGAGKTILFSRLIQTLIESYDMRVAVIAHREILVRQAHDKLLKVWPEGRESVGIACASVSSKAELDRPVLIASPQTLVNRLESMREPIHFLIVDECHRMPPPDVESQYALLLRKMEQVYPELRVLGVTATPYRLGHGFIYGDRAKRENWWTKLHCQVSIHNLQVGGFLVPYRAKQAEDITADLQGVKLSGGDFNLLDLEGVMTKEIHISSAVKAVQEHGQDRRAVVVFCATILHAETVAKAFTAAGFSAGCVHSKMDPDSRRANLAAFDSGRLHVVCNVGVLTEGWDSTGVDCIVLCRPTKSPALYVQMIGRGLRPHEGKTDCLILDLSGNCMLHGDPNDPVVNVPGEPKDMPPPTKACPECQELVHISLMECPACGYLWPKPEVVEAKPKHLVDVDFVKPAGPAGGRYPVRGWSMEEYVSRAGNRMAKLSIKLDSGGIIPLHVNHFLDFDGEASEYGQRKAWEWWNRRIPENFHDQLETPSVEEAIAYASENRDEFYFPTHVTVVPDGKYLKIASWQ